MKLFGIRKAVEEFQDVPFDGIFNVLAINGILDYDNLYSFALKLNREQGLNINVITENTLIKNIRLKDIIDSNSTMQLCLKANKNMPTNIKCDVIRLILICEYNINNFIDLDLIIDKQSDMSFMTKCFEKNWSGFLSHTKPVKFMYEILKLRSKANLPTYDNLYNIPSEFLKSYGQHWLLDNKDIIGISHIVSFFRPEQVSVIVIDHFDRRLFEIKRHNYFFELIDYKHFKKDKLREWHRTADDNYCSDDYYQKLLNVNYYDINLNKLELK